MLQLELSAWAYAKTDMTDRESIGVAAVAGCVLLYGKLTLTDQTEVEQFHDLYAQSETHHTELERHRKSGVNKEVEQIRAAIDPIKDVGTATSRSVAREFHSSQNLHGTDQEDLENIHRIGAPTAETIIDGLE